MKRLSAFTLIEILVVIALIAILFSLLLPVFGSAKKSAFSAVCLSNLHQQAIAFDMYKGDSDGYYPYAVDGFDKFHPYTVDPQESLSWEKLPVLSDILYPYTKSLALWHCPLDNGRGTTWRNFSFSGNSYFQTFGTSYQYTTEISFEHVLDPLEVRFVSSPSVVTFGASQIVLIVDLTSGFHGDTSLFGESTLRQNVLFSDMHVKSTPDDLSYQVAFSFTGPMGD